MSTSIFECFFFNFTRLALALANVVVSIGIVSYYLILFGPVLVAQHVSITRLETQRLSRIDDDR